MIVIFIKEDYLLELLAGFDGGVFDELGGEMFEIVEGLLKV